MLGHKKALLQVGDMEGVFEESSDNKDVSEESVISARELPDLHTHTPAVSNNQPTVLEKRNEAL